MAPQGLNKYSNDERQVLFVSKWIFIGYMMSQMYNSLYITSVKELKKKMQPDKSLDLEQKHH